MNDRPKNLRILAARVFDSISAILLVNQAITISRHTGLIVDVRPIAALDSDEDVIILDMREQNITLIPGLIDTHVHLFLYQYADRSWTDQVTKESTIERTIRATVHARNTLMAGYTTVRDLGTEGAEDADVALRKSLSGPNPITVGPRLYTASRAIVSTGAYGPKGDNRPNAEGVDGKTGAVAVDGHVECLREVRRQVGAGADWIKIYADYPVRSRQADVAPRRARRDLPLFTPLEFKTMIDAAHSLGVKVSAHATRPDTIQTLISLGVDSVEHGVHMDTATLQKLKATNGRTTWVPTLAAYNARNTGMPALNPARELFKEALRIGGIKISCGGDTGVFAHGTNALELLMMIEFGADWRDVLKWATYGGWECIRGMEWDGVAGERRLDAFARAAAAKDDQAAFDAIGEWPLGDNDVPLGAIKAGFAADLVGLEGDFLLDGKEGFIASLGGMDMKGPQKVAFVMKSGRIHRMNGQESFTPM